jgi:hypothetical protein
MNTFEHRNSESVIDAFVGRTYQRRPNVVATPNAGDKDSNTG